jgi:hypothetical protein
MALGPLMPSVLLLLFAFAGEAQEPIHSPAAIQPSAGTFLLRQQFTYVRSEDNRPGAAGADFDQWVSWTRLNYGLNSDVALTLDVPLVHRNVRGGQAAINDDSGGGQAGGGGRDVALALDDITLGLKLRLFKIDTGPVDTTRASLIAAVELPTGTDGLSSNSWDFTLGAAVTSILGRHGLDAAVRWRFNTGGGDDDPRQVPTFPGMGPADALLYDAAYLFRVAPAAYAAGSNHATYLVLEANGVYETNGDHVLMLSPGLMFEARNFAAEISIQLPAWSDVEHRPETRFTVTAGLRFLF